MATSRLPSVNPATAHRFGPLSRILEVKRTLSGTEKRFECAVLHRKDTHVVVLFVLPAPMHVHGVDLPAGTVTFGHFWTDRPYNVYHWLDQITGATIGHYVNLSDGTRIEGDLLEWRDLAVDILLSTDGRATILDEDEVPADTSEALSARIDEAKAAVLAAHASLVIELERHRIALWPSDQSPVGQPPVGAAPAGPRP